jgi:hypothetical protein
MFFLWLCLTFGLLVGSYFISQTMHNGKSSSYTTDVKDLAVRLVLKQILQTGL